MSIAYGNLCTLILKQCFGEAVEIVGECLFSASARTLTNIVKTTNLSRKEVIAALSVLIKYELLTFEATPSNLYTAEYSLKKEEILYILRYPRYVYLIQTKYGATGVTIAEELLQAGSQTASNTLIKCMRSPENAKLENYRDTFMTMVRDNYLIKCPLLLPNEDEMEVPKFNSDPYDLYQMPEMDLIFLAKVLDGTADIENAKDAEILWKLNLRRFHQDFRDDIMINAMERKLGTSAAECFSYILQQMYLRTDPWEKDTSNPVTFVEIKQSIEKKSNNLELMKYLDQYISVIADDSLGFLRKVGEMGGGQYVVQLSHGFEQLAYACVQNVIMERFGSKASRIFRVIQHKIYIDQDDLQKEAMVPTKETKLLAYTLFQEQFIQIKTIRKTGGGGTGPAKAFFLYHIKGKQIIQMLLDTCFKALYNDMTRSNFEKNENKRIIDKSQKLNSIVATMKERGEPEDLIADILETLTPPEREILQRVQKRIKKLSKIELTLDDTILLLQMYLYHSAEAPVEVKK